MFTKEEIAERTKFIGASEAAAVVGMSRWATPMQVWAEKTGQIEVTNEEKLWITLGNKLENTVAELFMEKTGKKVRRVTEAYTHPQYSFLRCHIDRKVEGEKAILQCKTASAFKSKEWKEDDIPQEYILQEYHELACTGYEKVYIACLIGNTDFQIKEITRDAEKMDWLIKNEVQFWNNYVIPKVMPIMLKPADNKIMVELFPQVLTSDIVYLPDKADNADALFDLLQAYKDDIKKVEQLKEQTEAQLKALIGTHEGGATEKYLARWKNVATSRLDVEKLKLTSPEIYEQYLIKTSGRRFTIKELGGKK